MVKIKKVSTPKGVLSTKAKGKKKVPKIKELGKISSMNLGTNLVVLLANSKLMKMIYYKDMKNLKKVSRLNPKLILKNELRLEKTKLRN